MSYLLPLRQAQNGQKRPVILPGNYVARTPARPCAQRAARAHGRSPEGATLPPVIKSLSGLLVMPRAPSNVRKFPRSCYRETPGESELL